MRFVGIDLGLKRIGLAVSDGSGTLARPLRTLTRGSSDDEGAAAAIADAIGALARRRGRRRGHRGGAAEAARRIRDGPDGTRPPHGRPPARLVGIPIVLQDERLSSREAESRLALSERDWRARKARLDAASAAVILQDYLDTPQPLAHASPAAIQD